MGDVSARHFEIMNYTEYLTEDMIKNALTGFNEKTKYAYILHDKDVYTEEDTKELEAGHKVGELKKPHWHVYVHFGGAVWSASNVAKKFGITSNYVNKIKSKRAGDMLEYLTHANESQQHKYQYSVDEVISNFDFEKQIIEDNLKKSKENIKNELLNNIADGVWREYNIYEYIDIETYANYERYINSAFKYRREKMKGVNRDMDCIYIYGPSGSGKTTLAKKLAKNKGYSVFISSGSNDPLDGYKGEDVIVCDDARSDLFKISDWLKFLDPHTQSSVKSRYYNKNIECKMLILTTSMDIDRFFNSIEGSANEDPVQFFRRFSIKVALTKDSMLQYGWQGEDKKFELFLDTKNIILDSFEIRNKTTSELLEYSAGLFGDMVVTANRLADKIKNTELDRQLTLEELEVFDGVFDRPIKKEILAEQKLPF